MDPLSLGPSIAGLISLVDLVVARTTKFYCSVRDAPKAIPNLIGETIALKAVLTSLIPLVTQQRFGETENPVSHDSPDATSLITNLVQDAPNPSQPDAEQASDILLDKNEHVLIRYCGKALERVLDIVSHMESRSEEPLRNIAQQSRWHFAENRLYNLLAKIERRRNCFQLATSLNNVSQIHQLLSMSSEILTNMSDVKPELQFEIRVTLLQQTQERNEFLRAGLERNHRPILDFLSAAEHTIAHQTAQKFQQPGTGGWFLEGEYFETWLRADKSSLWVHGIPGAGKTILASMAIDEIQSYCLGNRHRFAYFYCDFKDSIYQNPINMVGSLIGQLAMQEIELPETVEAFYDKYSRRREKPCLHELFDLLRDLLNESNGNRRTYIVLDALDECNGRNELLEFLRELQLSPELKVTIMVTSRKESDIEESFRGLPFLCIKEEDITADIGLYVTAEIEKDERLRTKSVAVKDRITSTLVAGAKGMFLWVKCQLDVLRKARTNREIYFALGNLPTGLEESYERILEGIDEDNFEIAFRAMKLITFSFRPLKVEELLDIICISADQTKMDEDEILSDPGEILDICGGLISSTSDTIGLAHYSVQEFLTSPRLSTKHSKISRYFMDPKPVHEELSRICLTYLSFDDFGDGPCKDAAILGTRLSAYPFLDYAVKYWGRHAELGDISLNGRWANELFLEPGNPKLLNLLEVRSYQNGQYSSQPYEFRHYDDENEGILCILTRLGQHKLSKKLLDQGVDVNAQGGRHGSALQAAANGFCNADVVKLLLERGADVNSTGGEFGTALEAASCFGNMETIKLLLEWGADVNARGGGIQTALEAAVINNFKEVVKLYLEHGADVNITGGYFGSPLRVAALEGCIDIAEMLLDSGADVNLQDKSGNSVLEGAAGSGNHQLVKLLIHRGADVNPHLGEEHINGNRSEFSYPLTQAARCGHKEIVQLLLENGADINTVDRHTALSAAALLGDEALTDVLLAGGADINGRNGIWGNPLAVAVHSHHIELAQTLLRHGANPDGSYWFTGFGNALSLAAARGNEKCVRLLIASGANVNATGVNTGSPLYHAAYYSNIEMVRLLLDEGAEVNSQGGAYGSPFLAAAFKGKTDIVELLLSVGAATDIPDCFGFNVTHFVKYRWGSTTNFESIPGLPDQTADAKDIDLLKCADTIRCNIRAIKESPNSWSFFETLARALLVYGSKDEAATGFERAIRLIGDGGAFEHTTATCTACQTGERISGPRYICVDFCPIDDLCQQCYFREQKDHGVGSEDFHEFLEIPRTAWHNFPRTIVNERSETLNQWLSRLEVLFAAESA